MKLKNFYWVIVFLLFPIYASMAQTEYCGSYSTTYDLHTMTATVCFDLYNRVSDDVLSIVVDASDERTVQDSYNQTFDHLEEGNYLYEIMQTRCPFSIRIEKVLLSNDDSFSRVLPWNCSLGDTLLMFDVLENDRITSQGNSTPIAVSPTDYHLELEDADAAFELEDNCLTFSPITTGDYSCNYYFVSNVSPDLKSNVSTVSIHLSQESEPVLEIEADHVYEKTSVDVPLFFTPNGDGVNDVWQIAALDTLGTFDLRLYDRMGKRVACFENEPVRWNGTTESGTALPSSDYWYVLYLREKDCRFTGHVTILR